MDPRNDVWRFYQLSTGAPTDYEYVGYSLLARMLMLSTVHLPLYMDDVINLHLEDKSHAVEWNIHRPDIALDRLNQLFQMICNEAYMLFGEPVFHEKFPYLKRGLHTDTIDGVTKSAPYYFVDRDYVNVTIDEETGLEIKTDINHVPLYGHSLSVADCLHKVVGEVYAIVHQLASKLYLMDADAATVEAWVSKGLQDWLNIIKQQLDALSSKLDAQYGGCAKRPTLRQVMSDGGAPLGAIRRAKWIIQKDFEAFRSDHCYSHKTSATAEPVQLVSGFIFDGWEVQNGVANTRIGALDAYGAGLQEGVQLVGNDPNPDAILQGFHHEAGFISDAFVRRYDNGSLSMDTMTGLDQINAYCKRFNVITTVDGSGNILTETPDVANTSYTNTKTAYTQFNSADKTDVHWFYHGLVPLPKLYKQADYDALSNDAERALFLEDICSKHGGEVYELKMFIDTSHKLAIDQNNIEKPKAGDYRSYRRPYAVPGTDYEFMVGGFQLNPVGFFDGMRREGIWNLQQDTTTGPVANNDGNYRYSGTSLTIPHMPDRFCTLQYATDDITNVYCTNEDRLFEFLEDMVVTPATMDSDYIGDVRRQSNTRYTFIRRVRVRKYAFPETNSCKLNTNVCFRTIAGFFYGSGPWPQATGLHLNESTYQSFVCHDLRSKPIYLFGIDCIQLPDVYADAVGELEFPTIPLPHELIEGGMPDIHGSDVPPDGLHPELYVPNNCHVSHNPQRPLDTHLKQTGEPALNHDTLWEMLGVVWNTTFGLHLQKGDVDDKSTIPEVVDPVDGFEATVDHTTHGTKVDCV